MKVAITGTIGSGKSTVTAILREMGCNVISCDEINADLLQDKDYISLIENEFPDAVVNDTIDKKALSKIIFNDENARKRLNSLAHPLICQRVKKQADCCVGDVFVEVPLLAESGMEMLFDKIWLIVSDENLQISRVIDRDKKTLTAVKRILDLQKKDYKFCVPVTVIENNFGYDELKKKVLNAL